MSSQPYRGIGLRKRVAETRWFVVDLRPALGEAVLAEGPISVTAGACGVSEITFTDTTIGFYCSGGVAGSEYTCRLRFTTADEQRLEATIPLRVL